jgi:hypothetical protein
VELATLVKNVLARDCVGPSFGVLLDHRKVEALPTPKRARKPKPEIPPRRSTALENVARLDGAK